MKIQTRDIEEREFLIWLRTVEKRAILPLKWAILATALMFWILSHPTYWPPPVDVFALFTIYLMYNFGESYFLWLSRVNITQVRLLCIVSYCVDILFVTVLIYFDAKKYPTTIGPATDFYIFYFLLILRGFALFRTPQENLMANTIIGVIFIITLLWQDAALLTSSRNSMIRVVFIWLVVLMSWFIVEIINHQKDEIMRARENLIRSENLAILGELAAGVAHEINNPIGIISAYAEYLKKNSPPGDPRHEDFDAIYKEARRCENIVAEMLNYARPSKRIKAPVDMRVLNNELLDFLFRHKPHGEELRVEKDYPEHLPLLILDANQIKQALMNILLNARQAMAGKGGTLKVSLRVDHERGGIREEIEDSGSGIAPEDLKRAFDPFFTTRHSGTGLGLSITKRIIEGHGGKIAMTSVKGKGTTVEVFIPFEQTISE